MDYFVYAIKHDAHTPGVGWSEPKTTAVSAESEYGAIKRFCAFHCARIQDVEIIQGRKPQYAERRIEGHTGFDWESVRKDTDRAWEHT